MDSLLSLRWLWLVATVFQSLGCQAGEAIEENLAQDCQPIEWAEIDVGPEQILERFRDEFGIGGNEVELDDPCAFKDEVLVAVHGRGVTVPRHQSWLVIIKGRSISVSPSQ